MPLDGGWMVFLRGDTQDLYSRLSFPLARPEVKVLCSADGQTPSPSADIDQAFTATVTVGVPTLRL